MRITTIVGIEYYETVLVSNKSRAHELQKYFHCCFTDFLVLDVGCYFWGVQCSQRRSQRFFTIVVVAAAVFLVLVIFLDGSSIFCSVQ